MLFTMVAALYGEDNNSPARAYTTQKMNTHTPQLFVPDSLLQKIARGSKCALRIKVCSVANDKFQKGNCEIHLWSVKRYFRLLFHILLVFVCFIAE